jgi:hypothetical protein
MGGNLSNSKYLQSICLLTAISRIQVFCTFLKIRKWANIQESTSYDRRLPVKGLYYSITSPSQSGSWPNLRVSSKHLPVQPSWFGSNLIWGQSNIANPLQLFCFTWLWIWQWTNSPAWFDALELLSQFLRYMLLVMRDLSIEILPLRKKIYLAKKARTAVKHPFSGFGRVLAPI